MHNWFARWHARTLLWHYFTLEVVVLVVLCVVVIAAPTGAAKRLQERSLYMNSTDAGDTTFYRLSFRYMSPDPVGSVELLFCQDPIPYLPCDLPPGMSAMGVSLGEQLGEAGYTITQQSAHRLLLSRTATAPVDDKSSYVLDGIVNPTNTDTAFAVRIKTFSSTNGTGPQVDFGSVRGQVTPGIILETQVPPMLIFCLAQEVYDNCAGTNEIYYADLGELSVDSTLTAHSQMAVGTNASAGFVIVAHGTPMSAGTSVIDALEEPTASQPGRNQFGINLVANTAPVVGADPQGDWANAVASPSYGQPDKYKFVPGDVVAYSPNVSLMKKFTVSYIVNASPDLRPGVYTTTVNFVATGRF